MPADGSPVRTREAEAFGYRVTASFDAIRLAAEANTSVGRLREIEHFSASTCEGLRGNRGHRSRGRGFRAVT